MVPEKVRVSIGSAAVLGLTDCWLDVMPTTAYLMTYTEGRCRANCSFCPQARESSSSKEFLSRVLWPVFPTLEVMEGLKRPPGGDLMRVCIQAINYPGFLEDVLALMRGIRKVTDLLISLDSPPLGKAELESLKVADLDRISIPLDAATPKLFDQVKGRGVKGPYRWEKHFEALSKAIELFGAGRVMSNLIVGLGETEKEAVGLIQRLMDTGVGTVLFAFTPILRTVFADRSPPPLETYRRVQMARYLITEGLVRFEEMEFDEAGRLRRFNADAEAVQSALRRGITFRTSGCPGCNRPYYNERPSGPLYNYPRMLTEKEARREAEMLEVEIR